MRSTWDCVAKACGEVGKFSAEFEGHEMAMDAPPSLGKLQLCVSAERLQEGVKFFQQGSPKRQNATEHPPACLPSNIA